MAAARTAGRAALATDAADRATVRGASRAYANASMPIPAAMISGGGEGSPAVSVRLNPTHDTNPCQVK